MRFIFFLIFSILSLASSHACDAAIYKVTILELSEPFFAHTFSYDTEKNNVQFEPIKLFEETPNETDGLIFFEGAFIKFDFKKQGVYLSTDLQGWNSYTENLNSFDKETHEIVNLYLPHPSIIEDDSTSLISRPNNIKLGEIEVSIQKLETEKQ